MSKLGNWLYYRRKFKLFVFPFIAAQPGKKNILALTYERNWELPERWSVNYFDIHSGVTIINHPDLVIEREFNDGKTVYDALYKHTFRKKTVKAFWFIDAHLANKERMHYCDHFDFVFVAHSPYIEIVKKNTKCKNIFWLPLCYPGTPGSINKSVAVTKYWVSFVGRWGEGFDNRNEMIHFLQNEYGDNFFAATDYGNPLSLIRQSKITTNYSIKDDLNFRVFETLGHGTELVTNYVPDIDKIQGLKQRLCCFRNHEELKKNIDQLLSDNSFYKHNMVKVQEWIKENHTMKQRLAEMLEMIDTGRQVEYN